MLACLPHEKCHLEQADHAEPDIQSQISSDLRYQLRYLQLGLLFVNYIKGIGACELDLRSVAVIQMWADGLVTRYSRGQIHVLESDARRAQIRFLPKVKLADDLLRTILVMIRGAKSFRFPIFSCGEITLFGERNANCRRQPSFAP